MTPNPHQWKMIVVDPGMGTCYNRTNQMRKDDSMLTRNQVYEALNMIGNRFFTVTFEKKDGTIRTYNGRINVKKGLKNNERSEIVREAFATHGIIPIKIDGENYKAFSVDKVKEIHCKEVQLVEDAE